MTSLEANLLHCLNRLNGGLAPGKIPVRVIRGDRSTPPAGKRVARPPVRPPRCWSARSACSVRPASWRLAQFPARGSRFSLGTLLVGRLTRKYQQSTGSPSAEQPSVLGSWLDFSIHHFHSELRRLRRQTRGTFTPGFAQLHRAHQFLSTNVSN